MTPVPALPTRELGRGGPRVVALGAGLMSLGHAYGPGGSDEERLAYLDAAYALGQTNWDSSNIYADADAVVGKWFARNADKRDEIFFATKFGFVDPTGDPTNVRSDAEYVLESCEKSLETLQTGWIDLYYCHRVDGRTPIEKTVEAMAELKRQGKIKYLGLSEVSSKTLRRAHAVHPISAVQIEYSPFSLDIEDPQIDLMKTCKELGVAVVAYSPLGRGFLGGQIKSRDDFKGDWRAFLPRFSEENFPKSMAIVDKIRVVAENKGVTTGQVTLAWLLAQWEGVIPIPGTRRISALEENVAALKVKLTDEEIREIRKACENAGDLGGRYPEMMMHQLFADTPEL